MKLTLFSLLLTTLMLSCQQPTAHTDVASRENREGGQKVLRHVVMFKFKDSASTADIQKVEAAFRALPSQIKEIKSFEWGKNNSPENLNNGLTHCFFLTFASEADRAAYLPHPAHKAFGAVLTPFLDKVTVIDYWTEP